MRAFFGMLLVAATLAVSCTHEVTLRDVLPGAFPTKAPSATIHCDTGFTADERKQLLEAADTWKRQTSGLASITLMFDVDFTSTIDIQSHAEAGHNLMLQLESWMPMVQRQDGSGGLLLGVVSPSGGIHNPWRKPLTVGFVVDRLAPDGVSDATLKQIALHEFGHVLGVPHQAAANAIMFQHAIATASVCLKKPDLAAFCQVNECGTYKMYPCE